jgi:APA family basic amino acid/polyamine antiporter
MAGSIDAKGFAMDATTKTPAPGSKAGGETTPSVGFSTATAIAVADMIGIGVFTSLGFQVLGLTSGFSIMMLWIVGGIVAVCGALAYAELATALPRSGGEYNFLSRIYHRAVGFLAGWVSATVGFAAPVALMAMAFGKYFEGVMPGAPPLLLALALVWGVTAIHLAGIKQGSAFQNWSTALKVALIVAFIVAGFMFGKPTGISFAPTSADLGAILSAPFAISLVYVMYSYSGWNAATYIVGEVRDPGRTLPPAMLAAVVVVMTLYVLLNAVFLYTTPIEAMRGQVEVGLVAGRHIFGESGGRIVGLVICLGLIATVSSLMWIGPRVTATMGEDIAILRPFAHRNAAGAPTRAILFQAIMATAMLWFGSFESVAQFIQFSLMFCSALAVVGVIVLRLREPNLPRPYRVWAYPVTPLIFLAVTVFMMGHQFVQKPRESAAGMATMMAGLLFYFWQARVEARRGSN